MRLSIISATPRSRTFFASLLIALAVLTAGACSGDDDGDTSGTGINVVATTTQIGALTRAVASDKVRLTVLLSAGADAHDYEPDPKAIKKINDAAIVLKHGIGLDDWLDKSIKGAGGDKRVVEVTEGIKVLKSDDGAGEDDPHVWHNPQNAKAMVANIVTALSAADPKNAALFKANGDAYQTRLDSVDKEVRQLIDSIPSANRKMVTNHDAFGYFIDHFGLEFVGAVFPVSSKEGQASAKDLAELSELIKKEGVKAIFAEEEVDPKVASELAKDTGVKIVTGLYADSLGKKGSGAETIDGMLLFNARKIAEALR